MTNEYNGINDEKPLAKMFILTKGFRVNDLCFIDY